MSVDHRPPDSVLTHTRTQLPSPPPEEPAVGEEAMEVEGAPEGGAATAATAKAAGTGAKAKAPLFLPETTVYVSMLVVTSALRLGRLDLATELATALVGG